MDAAVLNLQPVVKALTSPFKDKPYSLYSTATQNYSRWELLHHLTQRYQHASQWNIGGVGSSGVGHVYFMYISCIFHVVCASFSTLAMRELADAKADFSRIWA